MITQTNETGGSSAASFSALDAAEDDAIPVSDEEIESAEPARPTLTSGLPAFSARSRPPARPSLRPRSSSTSLPPPRPSNRSGALLGSSLPPPSFPSHFPSERLPSSERDPWILANKTLELSRANARISALEDQIAFRDARILTLEEKLESAQQKLAELEGKLALTPAVARPAHAPGLAKSAAASAMPVSSAKAQSGSSTKPVSIPKPSDMSKPPSSRQPLSATAAAVSAAGAASMSNSAALNSAALNPSPVEQTPPMPSVAAELSVARPTAANGTGALTPEPPETNESVPPPSLVAELAASRAANGPEDLQRIAGIGPRFEAALRKQGITRVSQIAAWSDADIRQVAKALKIPKSRIVKGRWVETARELSK